MPSLPRLICFVLLAVLPAGAFARSPEETLVAYVRAIQRDGLAAAVEFTHPEDLASFRADMEPELERRVKSSRTRARFMMFADPYDQKKLRPFKDDADFAAVFIKWMSTSGIAGVTTFAKATVQPLGYVTEGEFRHVIARFTHTDGEKSSERVTVTTLKMDGAQPMLTLPAELQTVAEMVRGLR